MKHHTRRQFLAKTKQLSVALATMPFVGACGRRIVEVQRVIQVEKEITRIVSQIVRETVIVESTPEVIEKTVEIEKIVTAEPAPPQKASIVADVSNRGWSQFAMLMSPAFEELFPNVTIEWRSMTDWGAYPARIAAMRASDQLGDLIEAPFGTLLASWYREHAIRPLNEATDDAMNTEGIIQSALRACTIEGKLVGLPLVCDGGANLLLFNREVFDQVGMDPPTADWTLDDIVEAGAQAVTAGQQAVQQGAVPRYGYAVRYALPDALPMLRLFGASLVRRNGTETTIDGSQGTSCLTWAHRQMYGNEIAPPPQHVVGGPVDMLLSGRVAMLRQSFWPYYSLANLGKESASPETAPRIGATIYPTHPAFGTRGAIAVGIAYCITQKSQVAAQAAQWLKYMSGREMGVQMFLGGYAAPGCRVASWKDPRVLASAPVCAQIADVADTCDTVHLPRNLRLSECIAVWNHHTRLLWYDEITPQVCAARIARDVRRVLARPIAEILSEFDTAIE